MWCDDGGDCVRERLEGGLLNAQVGAAGKRDTREQFAQ